MNNHNLALCLLFATLTTVLDAPLAAQLTGVWDDVDIVHFKELDDGKSDNVGGSIAPDEKTMFLASDRPGGKGGFDLYLTTRPRVDAKWGAVTAVPGVNTPGDEIHHAAYFAPNGEIELFFVRGSSTSADVWTAKRSASGTWSTATRMGAEVNGNGIFNVHLDVSCDGTLVAVVRKCVSNCSNPYHAWLLVRAQVTRPFQKAFLLPAVMLRDSSVVELSHNGKLGLFHTKDPKTGKTGWVLARNRPVQGWQPFLQLPKLSGVVDAEIGQVTGRLYHTISYKGRNTIVWRAPIVPMVLTEPEGLGNVELRFTNTGALDAFVPIRDAKTGSSLSLRVNFEVWNYPICAWATFPDMYGEGVHVPGIANELRLAGVIFVGRTTASVDGTHMLRLRVPNDPGLGGLRLWFQSLLMGSSKRAFTSVLGLDVVN